MIVEDNDDDLWVWWMYNEIRGRTGVQFTRRDTYPWVPHGLWLQRHLISATDGVKLTYHFFCQVRFSISNLSRTGTPPQSALSFSQLATLPTGTPSRGWEHQITTLYWSLPVLEMSISCRKMARGSTEWSERAYINSFRTVESYNVTKMSLPIKSLLSWSSEMAVSFAFSCISVSLCS
jgi:hypothetical protein